MLAALVVVAALAHELEAEREPRWDLVGIPIVSFSSDEGVGLGATVGLHHHAGGAVPYRDDVAVHAFVTTKLIQRYELRWEGLDVLELPLRARVLGGYYSTAARNFCGFGSLVSCSRARAEAAADERVLRAGSVEREDFLRRFYLVRFMRPYLDGLLRWRALDAPVGVELFAGWRFAWHLPGDLFDARPYPGSLYATLFPRGERGPSSVGLVGVIIDERDFEPLPTRGYYLEASARAASSYWGSAFSYAGATVQLAGWHPLSRERDDVVVGARLLADGIVGSPPTDELAEIGGVYDHAAFGGMWIGRGVRSHRYLGKLKLVEQTELRGYLGDARVWHMPFAVHWLVFLDLAWIGADFDDLDGSVERHNPLRVLASGGVGLRVLVQETFVARLEVGVSPFEENDPAFYTPVGAPF